MATFRPHFNKSIAELEALHAAAAKERRLTDELLDELEHRSTDRAAALARRLRASLLTAVVPIAPPSPVVARRSEVTPRTAQSSAPVSPSVSITTSPTAAVAQPVVVASPGSLLSRPSTANADEPSSVLASWIALEALSPQTYRRPADLVSGDQRCVAALDDGDLPWERNERSRPKQQLYYQLVLGSIPMDSATAELVKALGADEEQGRREREKAPIAAILLDRNGLLLEGNSVAVSSFAWGLPIALEGDLASLGAWTTAERAHVNELTKQLRRVNDQGEALPLDLATIRRAFEWLVVALKIPSNLYEPPSFVLRIFHYFKSKYPPEVALLNSFFLADLARAASLVSGRKTGTALARFLGIDKVQHQSNLLKEHSTLEELVAPSRFPAAKWPSPGGHPLVTLQQVAVNAMQSEFSSADSGIVAVNGPPGTGKTTLLRDIVASCVLDRAKAMVMFDDPTKAFSTSGQKVAAGDRAFLHLYRLDDSLKGHEVLIASSNNKAVENVSRELPAASSVGREISYFRTVSDRLAAKRTEHGTQIAGEPTWGLIAAVLGNALNRNAFQQAVWWDEDRSLRLYLKAAKGDSVVREILDEAGDVVRRVVPTVIEHEAPPTPEQAKINWKKAQRTFKLLLAEVEAEIRKLENVRKICKQLAPARAALVAAENERRIASAELCRCMYELTVAGAARTAAAAVAEAANRAERQTMADRPAWFARLFHTARFRTWEAIHGPLANQSAAASLQLGTAIEKRNGAEQRSKTASTAVQCAQNRNDTARIELAKVEAVITQYRQVLGERLVDEDFFKQEHDHWNVVAPWMPDALHRKREDLFAAALAVHRAFIDINAQKVSHNLGVLMSAMHAGAFQEEAKKALLPDLWSTAFLVVPAMSTTFASVDRMMGDLPSSSIGWLLIDEAGQAAPQSAVGALMRAKRAIVVGDPLQIPPVVSIPPRLVTEICKHFNVAQAHWAAPDASVQTVSDEASRLQAEFRADVGVRTVGLPLLVHRRCQEPMFGVSNRIAYDGQMVYAAGPRSDGPIGQALGASSWLNVDGTATTKWCAAEGEVVVQLLKRMAASGVLRPDAYIITPFRIVAQEMRRRLGEETGLFERLQVDPDTWIRERVGTIHTFQGKEAEAVIAVLGAPMTNQQGARRWASSSPNILNVMVSRAKRNLYVVGSKSAWGTVGHTRTLASALPERTT